MPRVLTTKAKIKCPHMVEGVTTAMSQAVTVDGGNLTVEGDTGVFSCPSTVPCVGYTLKSMGLNASTLEGRKVILVTDFQQSVTGLPLTIEETHFCYDDTTPAPIPAGSAAPPPSPAMADENKPTVTALVPGMAFTVSTMLPPVAAYSFSLSHPYPLSWTLTLINNTSLVNVDLTNGAPGATVAPSGGAWSSPSLSVSITLTAAFMAALGPSAQPHELYLTGVSQRGVSDFAKATLTVS